MITEVFNGWNIVALPSAPGFTQVQLTMQDKISAVPSQWSQQAQIFDWQIDWWEAHASTPPMTRAVAQQWTAFLAQLRGMAGAFLMGDPLGMSPSGLARGAPLVDGTNTMRSNTLSIRGLAPSLFRQLLPGDYLQVGHRLHMNLNAVNSDSAGKATLSIWPRLRETVSDGAAVILHNPQGLFRLADNKRTYSLDAMTRMFGISFDLTEAL